MKAELLDRIQDYLSNGGLFNPEMMEPDKVRQLIMDCRDSIKSSHNAIAPYFDFIAIEANRQRGLLIRALEAQGRGDQAEVTKLLKELQTPQARKAIHEPD